MKKAVVLILLLTTISYAVTLDALLKNVPNSPEIFYEKLQNLKPVNKNLSMNFSQKGTEISIGITYPLSALLTISAYGIYDGSLNFGIGGTLHFNKQKSSINSSLWQKIVMVKLKIIDLYFDIFINPETKEEDMDWLKYLSSIPLDKEVDFQKPAFLVLKKDKDTLFNEFYRSISYTPYKSSFGGYNIDFKIVFTNPTTYDISMNLPVHFDYDKLINEQYSKILLTKMTILFRKAYRNYYATLQEIIAEKTILDDLNKKYIMIYNENIQGKISYSQVMKQKKLIQEETKKIELLSLKLTKYAYEILALAGER